jgi:hypothetical protein
MIVGGGIFEGLRASHREQEEAERGKEIDYGVPSLILSLARRIECPMVGHGT